MDETSRKWIEAGKAFASDANAFVLCPRCGAESLQVIDVPYGNDPPRLDRYLYCRACGSRNVLSMTAR